MSAANPYDTTCLVCKQPMGSQRIDPHGRPSACFWVKTLDPVPKPPKPPEPELKECPACDGAGKIKPQRAHLGRALGSCTPPCKPCIGACTTQCGPCAGSGTILVEPPPPPSDIVACHFECARLYELKDMSACWAKDSTKHGSSIIHQRVRARIQELAALEAAADTSDPLATRRFDLLEVD